MPQLPVPAEVAEASRSLGLGASAPELHGGLCGWLAGGGAESGRQVQKGTSGLR